MSRFFLGLLMLCAVNSCGKYERQYHGENSEEELEVGLCGVGDDVSVGINSNGGQLFENNCKSCHHPNLQVIGPKLKGIQQKWEEETGSTTLIYEFLRNRDSVIESSEYIKELVNKDSNSRCKEFELTDHEIDAIFRYCS